MKKRIVSALLMAGLLIGLAGYSYNAQYVQKQEIKHFTAFFSVTGKMLNTQMDGVPVSNSSNKTSYTLENVTQAHTVTVVFATAVRYDVS